MKIEQIKNKNKNIKHIHILITSINFFLQLYLCLHTPLTAPSLIDKIENKKLSIIRRSKSFIFIFISLSIQIFVISLLITLIKKHTINCRKKSSSSSSYFYIVALDPIDHYYLLVLFLKSQFQ